MKSVVIVVNSKLLCIESSHCQEHNICNYIWIASVGKTHNLSNKKFARG